MYRYSVPTPHAYPHAYAHAYPHQEYNPYSTSYPHHDFESDGDDFDQAYPLYPLSQGYMCAPRRSMPVDPFSMAAAEAQRRRYNKQRAAAYRQQQQEAQEAYENAIRLQIAEQEYNRRQAEMEFYEREIRRRQQLTQERERERQRDLQRQRAILAEQEARRAQQDQLQPQPQPQQHHQQQQRNPLLEFINLLNNAHEAKENPARKSLSVPSQPMKSMDVEAAKEREQKKASVYDDFTQTMLSEMDPASNSSVSEKPVDREMVEHTELNDTDGKLARHGQVSQQISETSEIPRDEKNPNAFTPAAESPCIVPNGVPAEPEGEEMGSLHAHYTTHLNRRTALQTLASIDSDFESKKRNFTLPENLTFQPSPPPSDLHKDEHHEPSTPKLAFSSNNHDFLAYEHGLLELLTSIDSVPSGGDLSIRKVRKALVKKIEKELEDLDKSRETAWRSTLRTGDQSLDSLKISSTESEVKPEEEKTLIDSARVQTDFDDQHDSDTESTLSVDTNPKTRDEPNGEENATPDVIKGKEPDRFENTEPNQSVQIYV